MDFFKANAGARWKSLVVMPHNNPGFDVKAVTVDGIEELIEVKGQTGEWSRVGVVVTPTELAKARELGSRYWLCIVEFALDPARSRMYLVRNPYGLATEFRFDCGWKNVAVD
ncbi:MAG: DUF3883 domain-containing protein [Pseudomonadota bacterium]|nr:DUF3883 domain-containing protein [Pseudomonadota bacterium]